MGPRAGLEGTKNLAPTGILSPDRLAGSESLHRLYHPGPRGGRIPPIFKLSTKYRLRGQIHIPAALSLGKETQVTNESAVEHPLELIWTL